MLHEISARNIWIQIHTAEVFWENSVLIGTVENIYLTNILVSAVVVKLISLKVVGALAAWHSGGFQVVWGVSTRGPVQAALQQAPSLQAQAAARAVPLPSSTVTSRGTWTIWNIALKIAKIQISMIDNLGGR